MPLLHDIRNKPPHEKIRLIWIIAGIAAILLIILWVLTSKINKNLPKDTSLFKTIGQGIKDVRDNYKK